MKKTILLLIIIASILTGTFYITSRVLAQSAPTALDGLNQTAGEVNAYEKEVLSPDSNFLQTKAGQIVGVVLSFVGVLFLILMIYAGITWMTAQGNDQQVAKAKSLLVNSIIGLIIVFAAYAITTFIGNEIIG